MSEREKELVENRPKGICGNFLFVLFSPDVTLLMSRLAGWLFLPPLVGDSASSIFTGRYSPLPLTDPAPTKGLDLPVEKKKKDEEAEEEEVEEEEGKEKELSSTSAPLSGRYSP